jgi:hypothetical protein
MIMPSRLRSASTAAQEAMSGKDDTGLPTSSQLETRNRTAFKGDRSASWPESHARIGIKGFSGGSVVFLDAR